MARRYDRNPLFDDQDKGAGTPSIKKVFAISLIVVLAVVGAGGGLIYNYGHSLFNMSNYVADEDVQRVSELPVEAVETVSTEERQGIVLD